MRANLLRDFKEYKFSEFIGVSVFVFSPEQMIACFGENDVSVEILNFMNERGLDVFCAVCNVLNGEEWTKYFMIYGCKNEKRVEALSSSVDM